MFNVKLLSLKLKNKFLNKMPLIDLYTTQHVFIARRQTLDALFLLLLFCKQILDVSLIVIEPLSISMI